MGWEEKRDIVDQHAERHQHLKGHRIKRKLRNSQRGSRKAPVCHHEAEGVTVKEVGSGQGDRVLPRLVWIKSASGPLRFSPRAHW